MLKAARKEQMMYLSEVRDILSSRFPGVVAGEVAEYCPSATTTDHRAAV
jgi:hypothetical protein